MVLGAYFVGSVATTREWPPSPCAPLAPRDPDRLLSNPIKPSGRKNHSGRHGVHRSPVARPFANDLATFVAGIAIAGMGGGAFAAVDVAMMTKVMPATEAGGTGLAVVVLSYQLPQLLVPLLATPLLAIGHAGPNYFALYVVAALFGPRGAPDQERALTRLDMGWPERRSYQRPANRGRRRSTAHDPRPLSR
jgi:MFS family permease